MQLTFEQALELTDRIGNRAAYEIEALRGLWEGLLLVRPGGILVEIGCSYGRSTSLIAQVAKQQRHELILIDPFVQATATEEFQSLTNVLRTVGWPFTLHYKRSQDVTDIPYPLDFVHIDGDHSAEAVWSDCQRYLFRLRDGGVAAFHDYGIDSLPEVKPTVDKFVDGWPVVGTWGTCHVVRKP